jgi:hypothetical protein
VGKGKWTCVLVVAAFMLLQGAFIVLAETPYDAMIMAIQRWHESNPEPRFKSADSKQVFEWRVSLEKFDYKMKVERFQFYERLLSEIGDRQFTHKDWRYNAKSIRAKMLTDYPFWDYTEAIIGPVANFGRLYDWYKENISSQREHLYWLRCFLSYVSDLRDHDTEELLKLHHVSLNEICQQYIALLASSDLSPIEAMNIDYVYSELTVFASSQSVADELLSPLAEFTVEVGSALTEDTKDALISFIVPDYIDNDYAIKIYASIMK